VSLVLLIVSGSASAVPSTREFTPESAEKQAIFQQARKDVYPKQARQHPERYAHDSIAWAGIVKDTELFQSKFGPAVKVLIQHHYFDWLENHGAQPEVFFLSPRGEGEFMIIIRPDEGLSNNQVRQLIPAGTMVVVVGRLYARSAQFKDKPLAVITQFFQFLDKKRYRTDVFDYGREGEPIKRVQGGKFWGTYGPK
jgi:hypothetical protein